MCCLYCGKEIGAFRLLRDSEFCSALHRKKYGDRLDKALHEIAVPEAAPAGIAGFLDQMPLQPGNVLSTLVLWQSGHRRQRTWTGAPWPLTIATSEAADPLPDALIDAPADFAAPVSDEVPLPAPAEVPPLSERWMKAPAAEPVAAFVRTSSSLAPAYTLRTPRFAAGLEVMALPDTAKHPPAECAGWMTAPPPEPVAAFVQASTALTPLLTLHPRTVDAGLQLVATFERSPHGPAVCHVPMQAPAPEPVAAFVRSSAALTLVQTLRLPQLAVAIEPMPFVEEALETPGRCERWIAGPVPEPVAAWVQPSAALTLAVALRLPSFSTQLEAAPAPHTAPPALAPAPELVAAFVEPRTALTPLYAPSSLRMLAGMEPEHVQNATLAACHRWMPAAGAAVSQTQAETAEPPVALTAEPPAAPQIPAPDFSALLGPLPSLDELLEPPAMCQRWMPAPGADPVFSYLRTSSAPAIHLTPALALPAFTLTRANTFLPKVRRSKTIPTAEAVMAAILPSAEAVAPVHRRGPAALPAVARIPGERLPAATLAACAPPPVAVESWLAAALVTVPLTIKHTARTGAEFDQPPVVSQPAPALGRPVAGLAPAALESFLVPSTAAAIAPGTALHLPQFAMSVLRDRAVPIYGARCLAPAVTKPTAKPVRLSALQPMRTLKVAPPEDPHPVLEPALPRPALLPVEFHTHRPPSSLVSRPEWIRTRPTLAPPRFLLRPLLDKFDEPAAQPKPARKESVVEIRNMPAAKRRSATLMAVGRVAAMLFMGVALWFATANFLGERRLAREVSSGAALSAAATPSAPGPNGAPAPHAPTGPVARVRQAIADRAALRIAENFRDMDSWDAAEKARPAGWNRNRDGYMNTGALALFRPTLKFTDYRMEFFGQIEAKSIGWTVRSTDTNNYHAMKLTVVEAGIRPFVALVHYNVVDGKSKHRTQTPLNVMVHNNRPLQFAVDVHGSKIVTSINGEEVDSFIDSSLVAGGVGFFSDAGERARLYWMKVSRNDDWLGHVCAMLAEGVGASSAELRTPEIPGRAPLPGLPGERDGMTLSAIWIALPYLSAARKARFFKTWRSEPWNT